MIAYDIFEASFTTLVVGVITVMGLSNANQLVGFLLLITSSSALAATQAPAPSSPFSTLSPLRALVPLKTGFKEFVSWSGSPQNATFNGFSVQVFEMAVQRLPFSLPYKLVPFGDGKSNPSYDDMVHMLEQGEADAIVADLTINNERLRMVDFTQPYMQSALMMVTPFKYGSMGTLWDFLQPFSMELWFAIMVAFFGTGFVMFILEHKNPGFHHSQTKPPNEFDDDDRPPAHATTFQYRLTKWVKRLVNVYWFTSLTVFFSQQESVTTHAGRFVTVVWLLVVLIFTSSYTASLASTLSAEQPYPTIQGFAFLLKSNVSIGYQGGSFIENYLTMLGVQKSRLKALSTEDQYANALKMGPKNGVGAVIDEMPYVTSFLNTECDFTTVGDQISYFGGFGFAFAKNSSLTDEVSLAILSMAQDGSLQREKDLLVGTSQCNANAQATSHMRLRSFGGLFIVLAAVYGLCVTWRVLTWQVKTVALPTRIGSMARARSPPPAAGSAGPTVQVF